MADLITVNFGALETAAADLKTNAGNLETILGDLKAYLDQLVWTGSAREAYQADQTKWNQGAEEIRAVLAQIGAAVTSAHQEFLAAENANTARFPG